MEWREFLEKKDDWDKQEKELDKKYKKQRKGKKGKKDISSKDAKDLVRRTYNGQTPNKFMKQVNSNMAADEEKHSGNRPRGDKRVPLSRVRTHTNEPLRYGGVAEDTPIGASHQSDHQLRTGRKEQYIEPENADLWKSWLEKTMTYRKTRGNVEMKYPTEGEEVWDSKQQKRVKEDKTPKRTNKLTSWESFLEKNNAIETSHKDEKEKVEWDGKFNSSTIRDDVKDEKSNSEEESLEELTDGDLVEIEKLKSEVDKIITDLTRNIKDPKRREDIVQRQADQKVKETVTKAWELFLVNKPMNQFDKQPQKKPDEKGLKPAPLTETVPILNPKGSIDPNKKTVSRLNHETGLRESVFIKGKPSTNPETDIGGGRPEEPNVVGDLKHGSVNSSDGRARGHTITDNAENRSILYNSIEAQRKIDEAKEKELALPATPKVEKPETEEEKATKRAASIRQFDRKERNADGSIKKSWELWLEKDALDGKQSPDGLPKLTAGGKEVEIEAKNVIDRDDRGKNNDMYKSWLEKMQGAGDARFGNQHLTGLDQKPVNNEEDEANILPEKEEKTDDKEEKQEKTDNKPYKALGGE